jgi:hypothetical protein
MIRLMDDIYLISPKIWYLGIGYWNDIDPYWNRPMCYCSKNFNSEKEDNE